MNTNDSHALIYPELSYTIVGICFSVHNEEGRYSRERQYADALERKLKEAHMLYRRELGVLGTGNVVDFLIDEKIVLEIKAKRIITKEDYFQIQRYLQILNLPLGLLVNFRDKYLKPIRIVKINTPSKKRFV
ncbi:MAG: GxxExxY protein [bacterium]|nr:GxxExxY protein [bacterium]